MIFFWDLNRKSNFSQNISIFRGSRYHFRKRLLKSNKKNGSPHATMVCRLGNLSFLIIKVNSCIVLKIFITVTIFNLKNIKPKIPNISTRSYCQITQLKELSIQNCYNLAYIIYL